MGVRISDRDLGMKKIFREIRKIDNKSVKAGVLKNAGKEPNGTSLVDVAVYNEFGTSHIPSRPFIRIASDKNKSFWTDESEKIIDDIVDGGTANFNSLGKTMVNDIKDVMGDTTLLESNAPSTIRRKGRNEPLIDKGKLKSSIDFEVD